MSFILTNQNNSDTRLGVSSPAWHVLLDMAVEHGWNPMGTLHPEWVCWSGSLESDDSDCLDVLNGSYIDPAPRLVVLDDALNLADALERASMVYEPVYTRSQEMGGISLSGAPLPGLAARPGLGTLESVVEFCRLGAFQIEKYR